MYPARAAPPRAPVVFVKKKRETTYMSKHPGIVCADGGLQDIEANLDDMIYVSGEARAPTHLKHTPGSISGECNSQRKLMQNLLKQSRTILDKPISPDMLKFCVETQKECLAAQIQMLQTAQINGAGLDFGVTGAKVRKAGDIDGKGACVSRKAAKDVTGAKGSSSSNQTSKKQKNKQPPSAAPGLERQPGAGEFFEQNGPGAPKRAKMALPLSRASQRVAKAAQEKLDKKKKSNQQSASDRKQTDLKRNKKN